MATATTRFDQMFDSMFHEDAQEACNSSASQTQSPGAEPETRRATDSAVESHIQEALALFNAGHYAHCLNQVRKVETVAGDDPRVAAAQAACNALVEGRLGPGIRRCTELIEQAFYLPDLYCALGVLLVKSRQRARACRVLQKGLQIDPHHPGLLTQREHLGVRRKPPLGFLKRSHPANRMLGVLRARLSPV